jgi:signal transduction histidine kinase
MPPPRKFDRIVRIGDATKEPAYAEAALRFGVRSYLAVPVISRSGQVLGGLVFAHGRPGVFTERAEKLVAGIAAQAGVALDNAKLYSESQAINRVKDEFLATLSHELRTPLNVILGYSELLKDEKLPDGLGSYVDAVYRNAKAQNQLIADLLDISAIITGKLNFQPVHINTAEVVKSAIENIRFAAESKGVALEARFESGGCPIVGDPTRIQQIVWNLLSNAVKFTPAGGRVSVSTHADHGRCVIEVGDTGIGIDADFIPYVFDRFSQEDTGRSRRFGGLGLGLSIVRQLVELHGGQIRVYSGGKDQGTQFTVSLPLAPSTPPPPRSGVEAVG